MYQSVSALLCLGESTSSGGLVVEHFQPFLDVSGELHISSCCISSPSSTNASGRYPPGQLRILTLIAPCWMGDPWLYTALCMLEDVPYQCPTVNNLVRQGQGQVKCLELRFTSNVGKNVQVSVLKRMYQTMPHVPIS